MFINIDALSFIIIYFFFNFGVCKGVRSFGKQSRNYTVYFKTVIKANHEDKQ